MAFSDGVKFLFPVRLGEHIVLSERHDVTHPLVSINEVIKDKSFKLKENAYIVAKEGVYTFITDVRGSNWIKVK